MHCGCPHTFTVNAGRLLGGYTTGHAGRRGAPSGQAGTYLLVGGCACALRIDGTWHADGARVCACIMLVCECEPMLTCHAIQSVVEGVVEE
eukprot:1491370-Prymnesium_polylepis.2